LVINADPTKPDPRPSQASATAAVSARQGPEIADVRMSCLTWNSGCVVPTNSDGGARVPDAELEYDSELVYRHHGIRFTGVGYEQTPAMRSEITYVDGLQHGPARDWSADGRLVGESYYFENTLHGWQRAYGDNGEPLTEELFLYGILVRRIDHRADGVREWNLPDNDEHQLLLARFRSERDWPERAAN
jgi:hypothetical protein